MASQSTLETQNAAATFANRTFSQLVDGELISGRSMQPVINPSTGRSFASAPVATTEEVNRAVTAAKRAFQSWRHTSIAERVEVARNLTSAIQDRYEEIALTVALEVGKPIAASRADVDLALMWARGVLDEQLHFLDPTIIRDNDSERVEMHHRPAGVVAAIVPWNFPFFQTMYKLIPALVAGNTLVIKPAPTSPLNGLLLAEIIAPLVPAGVVNVLGDGGDVGPQLSAHPDVDHVSFTGSTAAGRRVVASGADTLKRVVLELGGNDAAIVLDDADIQQAAEGVFTFAFTNTGQVCINIKRIFVARSIYSEFAEAFAKLAREAVVGDALDPATELGPIQNARQFETVKGYLETAKRDATVLVGGNVLEGPGFFVEPTVLVDVDPRSTLINEETFGPVRSLIPYDDIEEAIQKVNDTHYGLGNSVWGRDLSRAAEIAAQLESGTVWVNNHFALSPDVPFGGQKQSGLGAEFGAEGLLGFTATQVISITK